MFQRRRTRESFCGPKSASQKMALMTKRGKEIEEKERGGLNSDEKITAYFERHPPPLAQKGLYSQKSAPTVESGTNAKRRAFTKNGRQWDEKEKLASAGGKRDQRTFLLRKSHRGRPGIGPRKKRENKKEPGEKRALI